MTYTQQVLVALTVDWLTTELKLKRNFEYYPYVKKKKTRHVKYWLIILWTNAESPHSGSRNDLSGIGPQGDDKTITSVSSILGTLVCRSVVCKILCVDPGILCHDTLIQTIRPSAPDGTTSSSGNSVVSSFVLFCGQSDIRLTYQFIWNKPWFESCWLYSCNSWLLHPLITGHRRRCTSFNE